MVFQKSLPAGGAIFSAHCRFFQTSAQASSATAILPTANPPRCHRKTTQLPVEIVEGSISTATGAYRTGGDVSMIDSLEIFRIHVSCFLSGSYMPYTMIRLRMHRMICMCAFGGNLHLGGIYACFDAHAKANFFYGFKINES